MPRALLAALALVALAGCQRPVPAGPLLVSLTTSSGETIVTVTGLSSSELTSVRAMSLSAETWRQLFLVTNTGADTPIVGRYAVSNDRLEFHPLFPFDPGRSYSVRIDLTRLPQPRPQPVVDVTVSLPGRDLAPSTVVTAIYPSTDLWPANLLRAYVQFSAPMGRGSAIGHVKLLDDAGKEVEGAFLPIESNFWNGDYTRYTAFFNPGRVKEGILPNRLLGRPLMAGRTYTIAIDAGWMDDGERQLKMPYRRVVHARPAVARPIALAEWRIDAPKSGSRDSLAVTFPSPLDRGLLQRAIGVATSGGRTIEGEITIEAAETKWTFTPKAPWTAGAYVLTALSILEDPCGNSIGRAFEVDSGVDPHPAVDTSTHSRPFTIR